MHIHDDVTKIAVEFTGRLICKLSQGLKDTEPHESMQEPHEFEAEKSASANNGELMFTHAMIHLKCSVDMQLTDQYCHRFAHSMRTLWYMVYGEAWVMHSSVHVSIYMYYIYMHDLCIL